MIKFDKRIVQFGFGAVGKSFYEKVTKEIDFDENKIKEQAGEKIAQFAPCFFRKII